MQRCEVTFQNFSKIYLKPKEYTGNSVVEFSTNYIIKINWNIIYLFSISIVKVDGMLSSFLLTFTVRRNCNAMQSGQQQCFI